MSRQKRLPSSFTNLNNLISKTKLESLFLTERSLFTVKYNWKRALFTETRFLDKFDLQHVPVKVFFNDFKLCCMNRHSVCLIQVAGMFQDVSIGETKVTYVIKRVTVLNTTKVSWLIYICIWCMYVHACSKHHEMDTRETRICYFFGFTIISNPEKIVTNTPYRRIALTKLETFGIKYTLHCLIYLLNRERRRKRWNKIAR